MTIPNSLGAILAIIVLILCVILIILVFGMAFELSSWLVLLLIAMVAAARLT